MRKQNVMFDNPIIELLSRSNPFVITILHLTLISSILYYGLVNFNVIIYIQILLFLLGIFAWTLAEYVIHRFIFHWRSKNRILKVLHYALHGYHHENYGFITENIIIRIPNLDMVFQVLFGTIFFELFLEMMNSLNLS